MRNCSLVKGTMQSAFFLLISERRTCSRETSPTIIVSERQEFTFCLILLYFIFLIFQSKYRRTKLNTLIDFPVHGLDMRRHVYKSPDSHNSSANGGPLSNWSPWRRNRRTNPGPEDYIYDLYAVCNHYGNMMGGHYTGKI